MSDHLRGLRGQETLKDILHSTGYSTGLATEYSTGHSTGYYIGILTLENVTNHAHKVHVKNSGLWNYL